MMNWENNYFQFKSKANLDSIQANQLREKSFLQFVQAGLPTKKVEAWKYTSLTEFKNIEFKNADEGEELLTHEQLQEISKNLPSEFYNLVLVNGILNATLSDDLSDDVQILEVESSDFNTSAQHVENQMLNLTQAFLSKKIKIEIKKHKIFPKPLQIVFVQASKGSIFSSEKVDIHLQEKAELTLLVNSMSFANATADALNLTMQITLDNAANLKLIQLQNEDLLSYHFSQIEVSIKSNCHFQALAMSLGTLMTRNYLHLNFLGQQSYAASYGLTILDSKQHVDNYTFIQHTIGENQSVQHYKSILSGASESVFRGRVRIEPDAQKAHSEQLNNNLLLTREAQANSIPQLEIYADDVKAGHGSTIGQLNKEEIFYFLSRGINQFEAVKMLSYGYAKELIFKFDNETVQNFIFKSLQAKLERMIQNV
jgi:Fe-S cluster assembly protein SufD